MTALKQYWWVIAIALLCGIAGWFFKPTKTVYVQPSAVPQHQFDSMKFKQQYDSLLRVNTDLKKSVAEIGQELSRQKLSNKQDLDKIKILPSPEIVKQWNALTEDTAKLKSDGRIITTIAPIRIAVIAFIERKQLQTMELSYIKQDSLKSQLLASDDTLLAKMQLRTTKLTSEFYKGEYVKGELKSDLEKADKRNRTKNVIIGCAAGAAAVAIIVAILK
jgi:hypothetical protein